MDDRHFDVLARSLTDSSSRRGVLRSLAAATLGLAAIHLPGTVEARKRGKKRKRRKQDKKNGQNTKTPALQLNEFQCVDVGNACRGNGANCCSGICEGGKPKKGKEDKSVCVAHDVGGCLVEQDICTTNIETSCASGGLCFRTTGNAGFCAAVVSGVCAVCQRDADCAGLGLGDGVACVVCDRACSETGGTVCLPAAA